MSSRRKKNNQKKAAWLKLANFAEFAGLLLLANFIFLYFYYRNLNLNISLIAVVFIILFILDYIVSLNIFRLAAFRLILILLYGAIIIYGLINFAYYEVFGTFLTISLNQAAQVNQPLLQLISGYYVMIPLSVYLLAFALVSLLFIGSNIYVKRNRNISYRFERFFHGINFLRFGKKKHWSWTGLLPLLVAFALINGLFYVSLTAYKKTMATAGLSRMQYFSDLGVYGHLFEQFSVFVGRSFYGSRHHGLADNLPKLDDGALSAGSAPVLPPTDIGILKDNLNALAALDENLSSDQLKLPEITGRPHIIFFQLESVSNWPLKMNPNPMPFLSKLMKENISVENFFANSCITVNAEFATLCSFYPESTGPISDMFAYNNYYCLPSILAEHFGYTTRIFHANSAQFWNRDVLSPRWGFAETYFTPFFKPRQDDLSVLSEVVKKIKASDGPSFNYVISFTSHGPHDQNFIDYNLKHNNLVIKPYDINLVGDIAENNHQTPETIADYLGFVAAVDDAIANLFSELEKNDLLDNTIVVIYNDHRYYVYKNEDKVNGFLNYNKVPFVIRLPQRYQAKVQTVASLVDIAPTILNLLAGPQFQLPETFIGHSLFDQNFPNRAISKCLGENLYVSRDIILKNDNLLKMTMPLTFFNVNSWTKLSQYADHLATVVGYSDKIVRENELAGNKGLAAGTGKPLIDDSKTLSFNQETDGDKDGLSDLREKTLGTDKNNPDTDGDGFLDGVEVMFGFDPLSSEE